MSIRTVRSAIRTVRSAIRTVLGRSIRTVLGRFFSVVDEDLGMAQAAGRPARQPRWSRLWATSEVVPARDLGATGFSHHALHLKRRRAVHALCGKAGCWREPWRVASALQAPSQPLTPPRLPRDTYVHSQKTCGSLVANEARAAARWRRPATSLKHTSAQGRALVPPLSAACCFRALMSSRFLLFLRLRTLAPFSSIKSEKAQR
jgi:hypothetical protein